jgi:nitrite reductase/ring-hydroxylating ferredoxin subunit/uncharacterized membrane protein
MSRDAARPENAVRDAGERSLALLGRQAWLDRPGYRLEHALGLALAACGGAGERLSNLLHGTWLGHPLHPLLTALPTGAIATTLALDAAAALPGRGSGLHDAARLSLGVGILGSFGAAATGVNDWQHTHQQARRIGMVHGALNAAATGLYISSWLDRRRGRHVRGAATAALGYGVTTAAGYLGAALVYRAGTGVDRSGGHLHVSEWTPVLAASALTADAPQRVEAGAGALVLLRNGEQVVAVGERCPHMGAPMADGWMDRGQVVCPWHGSGFDPGTGQVLRGPATAPLPCYPTRIRAGVIEVGGRPAGTVQLTGEVA